MATRRKKTRHRCAWCKVRIRHGKEALKVVPVALGRRGLIETEDVLLFCSEVHAEKHFCSPVAADGRQP